MLTIKNLTVKAGEKTIIENLNFKFEKNRIYALMGPNGSGKSTLAMALLGHPAYRIGPKSKLIFKGRDISHETPDKRSKRGFFLSFQTPLSLSGITVFQMLRLALSGKKEPLALKTEIETIAKRLKLKRELLTRSLNDGASGGEKKKLEVLQAAVLAPDFLVLDEVDTGVDVDALKIIAEELKRQSKNKTLLVITHYNRILKYLKPDEVLVMKSGAIVATGAGSLAEEIEKNGYDQLPHSHAKSA